jgi:hypothetical protein
MTIIPNNPADDNESSASKKRNAELKRFFFRKAAIVAIKKTILRRAEHAINIRRIFDIVILSVHYRSAGSGKRRVQGFVERIHDAIDFAMCGRQRRRDKVPVPVDARPNSEIGHFRLEFLPDLQ